MAGARASYRRALRNRDFRLLVSALTTAGIGGWAYNVALVVYVYDHTHSAAWVSAATLGRMIPRFLGSPYAGVIAERLERVRLMVWADLIRAVLMVGMTVVVALNASVVIAIAIAAVVSLVTTVYDPATAAMLPQLLGEDDLAAGNAMTETINNVAVIAGPGIGAVVLALGSASIVMGFDAATFVLSAVFVGRLRARSVPTDVSQEGGPLKQMAVGVRAIATSAAARLLVSFTIFTTLLYGVDTVLFVFVSKEKLGTGGAGYGYLLVALGVGGVIAATFVNRLAALPRLSAVLSIGMLAYCLPTAALVVVHTPAVAFVIEVVRGIGTLIVDVLAMTALQRSLAPDLIARVFGVFWAVVVGALGLGAFVTPFLLNAAGLDVTLYLAAFVVPAVVVLLYPRLATLDRLAGAEARELAPRVAVFAQLDLFAAASQPALERLAKSATEVVLDAGAPVVREGEPADALYVLVDGELDVSSRGEGAGPSRHIRTMTSPAYVGEIGLLQGIPRTATVTASQQSRLWRISGDVFLSAMTEQPPSATFLSTMSTRLARTHPSVAAAPPPLTVSVPTQPADPAATSQPEIPAGASQPVTPGSPGAA